MLKVYFQIITEHVLNKDFRLATLNEKQLTDATELKLINGTKVYLSAIIDLYQNSKIPMCQGTQITINVYLIHLIYQWKEIQVQVYYLIIIGNINIQVNHLSRVGRCMENGIIRGFEDY